VLHRRLWVWMPGELVDRNRHSGRLVRTASYGDELGMEESTVVHLRYTGGHYELLLPKESSVPRSRL
ncbi:unnamed protein product, partial [Polarella glacialis]